MMFLIVKAISLLPFFTYIVLNADIEARNVDSSICSGFISTVTGILQWVVVKVAVVWIRLLVLLYIDETIV